MSGTDIQPNDSTVGVGNSLAAEHPNSRFANTMMAVGSSDRPGMALWRDHLYAWMTRNATRATDFFNIPPNRVVELGTHIEI